MRIKLLVVLGLSRKAAPPPGGRRPVERTRYICGQSLFELIVAIGLVSLILLALVGLATVSVRNASYSRNQAQAARIGQEGIEWLRLERDRSWSEFLSHVTLMPVACIKGIEWSQTHVGECLATDKIDNLFLREVEFSVVDTDPSNGTGSDRVEVLMAVYWTDARGYHEVKNSTYFTDWKAQ